MTSFVRTNRYLHSSCRAVYIDRAGSVKASGVCRWAGMITDKQVVCGDAALVERKHAGSCPVVVGLAARPYHLPAIHARVSTGSIKSP